MRAFRPIELPRPLYNTPLAHRQARWHGNGKWYLLPEGEWSLLEELGAVVAIPRVRGEAGRWSNYYHITTNGTTNIGATTEIGAVLAALNVGVPWTTAGTATVQDGSASDVVSVVQLTVQNASYIYDVVMRKGGIIIVTAAGTPGDLCVSAT